MLPMLTTSEAHALQDAADMVEGTKPDAAAIIRRIVKQLGADPGYVTTSQAGAYLGVTDQTIRNWLRRGWIPGGTRRFGHNRIPIDALRGVADYRVALETTKRVTRSDEEVVELVRAHRAESDAAVAGDTGDKRPRRRRAA